MGEEQAQTVVQVLHSSIADANMSVLCLFPLSKPARRGLPFISHPLQGEAKKRQPSPTAINRVAQKGSSVDPWHRETKGSYTMLFYKPKRITPMFLG